MRTNNINFCDLDRNTMLSRIENYCFLHDCPSIRIYACDARTLWLYSTNDRYIVDSYDRADYILADGRPIYWLSKLRGNQIKSQLTGPDLMMSILSDVRFQGMRHFFYGSDESTISLIKQKAKKSNINIVGAISPPYLSIDSMDFTEVESLVNEYKPDFFWCGLGAPKQEYLINLINPDRRTIMVGVGLGFNYYAENVIRSPKWMSKIGCEWLFRYAQQPNRISRFIRPFFFIIGELIIEIFKDIFYWRRRQ